MPACLVCPHRVYSPGLCWYLCSSRHVDGDVPEHQVQAGPVPRGVVVKLDVAHSRPVSGGRWDSMTAAAWREGGREKIPDK